MMFDPFNTGGRGIASLIQPLQMAISRQLKQGMSSQINDFGQKVGQLVSESFPDLGEAGSTGPRLAPL